MSWGAHHGAQGGRGEGQEARATNFNLDPCPKEARSGRETNDGHPRDAKRPCRGDTPVDPLVTSTRDK